MEYPINVLNRDVLELIVQKLDDEDVFNFSSGVNEAAQALLAPTLMERLWMKRNLASILENFGHNKPFMILLAQELTMYVLDLHANEHPVFLDEMQARLTKDNLSLFELSLLASRFDIAQPLFEEKLASVEGEEWDELMMIHEVEGIEEAIGHSMMIGPLDGLVKLLHENADEDIKAIEFDETQVVQDVSDMEILMSFGADVDEGKFVAGFHRMQYGEGILYAHLIHDAELAGERDLELTSDKLYESEVLGYNITVDDAERVLHWLFSVDKDDSATVMVEMRDEEPTQMGIAEFIEFSDEKFLDYKDDAAEHYIEQENSDYYSRVY